MWCSTGFDHRAFTFFLIYIMTFLDLLTQICFYMLIMFQHRAVEEIEKVLNNNFENICD